MKLDQTDTGAALDTNNIQSQGYRHYLIYFLDRVETGMVEELDLSQTADDVLEAYFFSENKQLHVFRYQNQVQAVVCEQEDQDDTFDETQLLMSSQYGESIRIRHFFTYDDDGQASVIYTKLCELNGGKEHPHA